MNIGINLLYLYPNAVGGTETYARGLIGGLRKSDSKNKYFLFCSRESAATFIGSKNLVVKELPVSSQNRVLRSLFEIFILPFYLMKYKIDVLHSLGYSSPLISPCPTIVNIYDLNWYYHPEDFSLFRRMGWMIFIMSSALFCTKIITSSYSSKKHILEILHVPEDKVKVIYGGIPAMEFPKLKKSLLKYGIKGKYIFTLTADVPHKNLMGLLNAYKILFKSDKKYFLVIGGLRGNMEKIAKDFIKKENIGQKIILLGWLPDVDLATLYKYATIFVIPSLHEGFGFPVLEAFISKVPLVSSNAFSLKEIVGKAGILFNPTNTSEMAKKIDLVMKSSKLRKKIIKLEFDRLQDFNWKKSANMTLKIYNSL
jgi:glycosyltransferase involved in cell wall biosynthesis